VAERSSADLDQNVGAFRFGDGNCLDCIRFIDLKVRTLEVIVKYLYDTSCTHLLWNCHLALWFVEWGTEDNCGVEDLIAFCGRNTSSDQADPKSPDLNKSP